MDQDTNSKEAVDSLNELFKKTSLYFTKKYKLLIYKLLKNGHVKVVDLIADSGLSESRLYQIVDEVEKLLTEEADINEKV